PTEGKLKVREVLQIDNPGTTTYVGKSPDGKGEPVTLELSIPSDFARVTFDKEFYGRRFWVRGGKLATSIPWTPGVRELGFTYLLGNEKQHYTWERTADLPTSRIRIVARTEDPAAVTCNTGMRTTAEKGQVVYSVDEALPAGRVIRLDLGRLPLPIMAYARWAALLFLVASVGVSWAVFRRRRAKASLGSPAGTVAPGKTPHQKRRAGRAAKR
ncbi:MAG: hypothetical protein HUU20_17525, partial [Pirellulales bacterium]|nr:hypothetical protein [Pirellulales bacterium]